MSSNVKIKNTRKAPANASIKSLAKAEKPIVENEMEGKLMKIEKLTAAEKKTLEMPVVANPSATEMDDSEVGVKDLGQALIDAERRGFEDMPWYFDIPKKERLHTRDVVYDVDLDRFGIFVSPARKFNLARVRLLKVASKEDVYTRDWFVPYESLALVKRGDNIKRGFVETDREYVRRAGKINRSHKEAEEPVATSV